MIRTINDVIDAMYKEYYKSPSQLIDLNHTALTYEKLSEKDPKLRWGTYRGVWGPMPVDD